MLNFNYYMIKLNGVKIFLIYAIMEVLKMNSRAYSEVYQIIQYLPKEEYKLIPRWQINYIKKNMDKTAGKLFPENTNILEAKLSFDAKTMLLSLYQLYISNDKQKEKFNKIMAKNGQDITDLTVINENSIFNKIKRFLSKTLKKKHIVKNP